MKTPLSQSNITGRAWLFFIVVINAFGLLLLAFRGKESNIEAVDPLADHPPKIMTEYRPFEEHFALEMENGYKTDFIPQDRLYAVYFNSKKYLSCGSEATSLNLKYFFQTPLTHRQPGSKTRSYLFCCVNELGHGDHIIIHYRDVPKCDEQDKEGD